jgi:hypothetical protein
VARPTVPVPPRYEEEEEEEEEDEDVYAPELPPDLAAARANPSLPRRAIPIGPARGPLRREEEEEESEDEEIGPALPAGAGPSHVHEDAVIEFMQKEAQRRQAIEVGVNLVFFLSGFPFVPLRAVCMASMCMHPHAFRQCNSLPPLLHRRRRAPRRSSVKSGCSFRPHLQIY